MSDSDPVDSAKAKRDRILAVSRTVHQIPVEEGGMLRPPKAPPPPPPPSETEQVWKKAALVAGGLAALASGFAAGLWVRRR